MDESFKYGELENLNMKKLIPSLFLLLIIGCSDSIPIEASDTPSPDDLVAHSEEFRKEVIEVTEGVHVAVGYALANAILVEGKESNIIIDTTGSVETAREVKDLFDEKFVKMWEFYMASCAAAFRYRDLVVFQLQIVKNFQSARRTRDYIYS